jgi:predicted phosphodiesterase
MSTNWTISRRRFLISGGVFIAGTLVTGGVSAQTGTRPLVVFGLLTDVHYADREPARNRYYRQSIEKMNECIAQMNREKPDFMIELGDFKDQDQVPDEAKTLKYLTEIEAAFRKFNGPVYHVLGNHDVDGITKNQFLERVENTGIAKDKSYYSFDAKGIHFVVLDANFTRDGKPYDRGNFVWNDTCIPEIEMKWLEKDLSKTRHPVVVFTHQLLDDSGDKNVAVSNAAEVRKVLEQSGKVLAVFQGHVHDERYSLINGIHYQTVHAMTDGEAPENNAYSLVGIFADCIMIDGFRRSSDKQLMIHSTTQKQIHP